MEARAVGCLHGSAQHTQIAGQGVDIDDVEVFFRRAHEHAESGATRRHEVTDDQRVGTVLIEPFAAFESNPADAFPGRLMAVKPHLDAGDVTVREMISALAPPPPPPAPPLAPLRPPPYWR